MSEIKVPFLKMNGLGNKIIVADVRSLGSSVTSEAAIALANNPETSFDQIMEISSARESGVDADIRIINSDGSFAQACGNGMRCVVSYMNSQGHRSDYRFRTPAGILSAKWAGDENITVDMGIPRFGWDEIPLEEEFADTTGIELQVGPIDDPVLHTPSVANMGNPHAVFWVEDDVWTYDLDRFGPLLENHPIFPERANISIARVMSRDHLILRTWERGAGLTLACGSAACAATVSAVRKDYCDRQVRVTLPGGDLGVQWSDDGHVYITGPAQLEFTGLLDPVTGGFVRDEAGIASNA